MFTGIIQNMAKVQKLERSSDSIVLTMQTPKKWQIKPGDSIATDGVCLTVTKVSKSTYKTELMTETLSKTTFGNKIPNRLNLERPLKLNDFLNGHIVQGHVDDVGRIAGIKSNGSSKIIKVSFNKKFASYVVPKGSIAIDGVSLTVVECQPNWFSVSLVKYTLDHTNLGKKKSGDLVNLEFDIIAKYAQKQSRAKIVK
jgi:riboflavin synthase